MVVIVVVPVAAEAAAAMVLDLALVSLVLAGVGVGVEIAIWAGWEAETAAGYKQTDDLLVAGGNVIERYSATPLPRCSRFHFPVSIHQ